MYFHLINYLAFLLVVLSVLLTIDLIITFKKPTNIKPILVLIPIVLIVRGIGYLYFIHIEYNRYLVELPFTLNGALALVFVSYLYYNKFHWFYVGFSLLFILFGFFFHIYYSFKQIGTTIPLSEISKELRFCKGFLSILATILFNYLFYKISVAFKPSNIYLLKFRKWLVGLFVIYSINIILIFINQFLNHKIDSFVLILNIITVLLMYFRPKYFNVINLKISENISFEKKNIECISDSLFINIFFIQQYYLNIEANVGQLCDQLGVKPDILKEYINKNYQMSITDLINKNRVAHFVAMIESKKNHQYTIEALSQLAGFGSRVNLYKNFKKFHGGKPSDLIKIIHS